MILTDYLQVLLALAVRVIHKHRSRDEHEGECKTPVPRAIIDQMDRTKTADRPHWVTIAIGVLSPSLAVIAVGISIISLNVSQRAFQVGQRAYVTVSPVEITELDPQASIPESELTKRFPISVPFVVKYQIKNLGNTPAFDAVLSFKQGGDAFFIAIENGQPLNIGPKETSSRYLTVAQHWRSADDAYNHYICYQCYMPYEAHISYRDVFGTTYNEAVAFNVYANSASEKLRKECLHTLADLRKRGK